MGETHKGCRHLDYEPHFIDCTLVKTDEGWYWRRDNPPYAGAPVHVQFCKLRGRINEPFDCLEPGYMGCYEAQDNSPEKEGAR